jgi:zinc protease
VSLDDLRHRVKTIHRPDNAVLIVVGDFELRQVEAAAKRWFGNWHVPEPTRKPLLVKPASGLEARKQDRIIVAHRPGATQTTVRVACMLPPSVADDEAAAEVLRYELGAGMFHALRWSGGSVYNTSVNLRNATDGTRSLVLRTDVEHHPAPGAYHESRRSEFSVATAAS